jgi:Tol biopolymer transport system component
MFTDMVGYSALTQKSEALALALLAEHYEILRPIFPKHGGTEIKTIGDAFLVEFGSALNAVECAVEIQESLRKRNREHPEAEPIRIRIGIHIGDIMHSGGDILGDGVNIAARIYPLAPPEGICITEDVARQVSNKLGFPLFKLGLKELKNISLPVETHVLQLPWLPKMEAAIGDDNAGSPAGKRRMHLLLSAVVFVLVCAILVFFLYPRGRVAPEKGGTSLARQVTFTGDVSRLSLSPDGKQIAYTSKSQSGKEVLFVQDLQGGRSLELFSGMEFHDVRWSPDGSELLLSTNDSIGMICIIPRLGGVPRRWKGWSPNLAWSPDGGSFACCSVVPGKIWVIDKNTRARDSINCNGDFQFITAIDWSPFNDRLLVQTLKGAVFTVWTIDRKSGVMTKAFDDPEMKETVLWSSNGNAAYYLRSKGDAADLVKFNLDPVSWKLIGEPKIVQKGLQSTVDKAFSISRDERHLVYKHVTGYSNLWLIHTGRNRNGIAGKRQLTKGTAFHDCPRFSPDGKRIAYVKQKNVYIMPVDGGVPKQITLSGNAGGAITWSPDGQNLAFETIEENGKHRIWTMRSDGSSLRQGGTEEPSGGTELSWSKNNVIAFNKIGNSNFRFFDLEKQSGRDVLESDKLGWFFSPRFSPDGNQFAYFANDGTEGKSPGLCILSTEDRTKLSLLKGMWPLQWSLDGKRIFIRNDSARNRIFSVSATGGKPTFLVDVQLSDISFIDITPDGSTIVASVVETQSDLWLIENFNAERK